MLFLNHIKPKKNSMKKWHSQNSHHSKRFPHAQKQIFKFGSKLLVGAGKIV